MGQQSSKQGGIFVQTDKPYYQPGDTVTGHVYINMNAILPTDGIWLKIKGFEKVYFSETETRWVDEPGPNGTTTRRSENYTVHHNDKNDFFSHKFKLYTWGPHIPIGQFSIPFQFSLQDHLPGTFAEEDAVGANRYKASIRYTIKAETDVPKGFDKLKYKQELVIREKVKGASKPQEGEMIKNTKTWCCVSQGESKIKSYFEYNSYMPGETANIITEIDNSQCKLGIKNVIGRLMKKVRLQAKGHSCVKDLTVSQNAFGKVLSGETRLGERALRTPVHLISHGKPIQPSTSGQLVQCHYFLQITSDMDGVTCCSQDPHVTIPIQLVAPPPPDYGKVQEPNNWNPQTLGNVNIAFTSDARYQPKGGDVNITINTSNGFNDMVSPPSMGMNVNTGYQPPNPLGGFNQPPQQQGGFNQPPQQQQGGFNQPPQQQGGFNQPPQQQGGFNQPPQQQQGGFNQPPQQNTGFQFNVNVQGGFDQPSNGFNQPPDNQNTNISMGTGIGFNVQATDSQNGQNQQVNMNFNGGVF